MIFCHKYDFCRDNSFVVRNTCLSPQNTSFVATKVCSARQNFLSRQTCICCDKRRVLSQQRYACRDRHVFVATDICGTKTFVATEMILMSAPANDNFFFFYSTVVVPCLFFLILQSCTVKVFPFISDSVLH